MREWYSFDIVDGQPCKQDGTQWHPFNPNYDPGPPPPPRLPREVKASMIIATESNGEISETKLRKNDYRSQRSKFYRPERDPHPAPSSSQHSAVGTSYSTRQRPQGQRTYEHNPQSKNSGHIFSQHRPTGAQRGSPAPGRVGTTPSSPSSNIRNGLGQSTEQAQDEKGYPKCPYRQPRRFASKDAPTALSK